MGCGTSGSGDAALGGSDSGASGSAGNGLITVGDGGLSPFQGDASAGMPVHTSYDTCMPSCGSFPADGTASCAATALPAPTVAYPQDGVLLPPNMNVLEVQFVPNSDATLFE